MDNKQRRTDLRSDSWSGSGPGGLVVYDPRTDEGHLLNPSTAVVFEACDGRTSVDEIAQRVADHTGLPIDTGIVELALSELAEVGLLEASEGSPLAAGGGLSRRSLIARLALGAGAIALLPVIDTVTGSSQLAAATPKVAASVSPPTADPKTATTLADTPVEVTLSTTGGFMTPISTVFALATAPTHGTATLVGDVATYTPQAGFTGTDTFTYIAAQCVAFRDALPACPDASGPYPETGTDPATVTVTVTAAPTTTTTTATTATTATTTTATKPAVATTTRPSFTG